MSRFDACLAPVLQHEGGFSNNPADPGGATNKGVTQRTYDNYRRRKGLPLQSVKLISDDDLHEIYSSFWGAAHCGELPAGVDYIVFDLAVNSGPQRAVKFLQRAVMVTADGSFGPITRTQVASRRPADIIASIYAQRRAFYHEQPSFPVFGQGWLKRLEEVFALALSMAKGSL